MSNLTELKNKRRCENGDIWFVQAQPEKNGKRERDVKGLIGTFKSTNRNVQKKAAEALVRIGEAAVEPLIQALKDERWSVRINAVGALAEIKDAIAKYLEVA